MSYFADSLRAARKRVGLSQRAVAREAGLSQGQWSNYENGIWLNIGLDTLYKIAEVLGTTVGQLVDDPNPSRKIRQRVPEGFSSDAKRTVTTKKRTKL